MTQPTTTSHSLADVIYAHDVLTATYASYLAHTLPSACRNQEPAQLAYSFARLAGHHALIAHGLRACFTPERQREIIIGD